MIISKKPLLYDTRGGAKYAIIEVVIHSWNVSDTGIVYKVTDYKIENGSRHYIKDKELFYSWDQLNSLNDYLELEYDYSGLSKKELEFLKVKHALLIETQTNPLYISTAEDWEFTEDNN